jgi:anti-sigma B factor antagonist
MSAQMRRNGDTAVLELEGRFSLGEPVEEFRRLWNDALALGAKNIVVNLSDVTMMDSSGIGTMIRCHSAVMQKGGKLRLVNPNATVKQAFKVTRLDSVFEFHDSEASALAASAS